MSFEARLRMFSQPYHNLNEECPVVSSKITSTFNWHSEKGWPYFTCFCPSLIIIINYTLIVVTRVCMCVHIRILCVMYFEVFTCTSIHLGNIILSFLPLINVSIIKNYHSNIQSFENSSQLNITLFSRILIY